MIAELIEQLKQVPEYFLALKGALAVLASGLPIYLGIRYFLYRRKLSMPLHFHLAYMSSFILFAGLAFLYASPLSNVLPPAIINFYLIVTCLASSYGIVMLIDAFLIQHYLSNIRQVYISPPMRTIIQVFLFLVLALPTLQYVMHFNPFAMVAIPTIATAGLALALQDTLKTFIAGVGLGKIIRLGDWIGYQGKDGQVVDINWARTVIRTIEGTHVFIPNSQLQTGLFSNYRTLNPANGLVLKIGASYDAPPIRVKQVLMQCLRDIPGLSSTPAPVVCVQDYGEFAVNYALQCRVEDHRRILSVKDEIATRLWYAFRREGIAIPHPIRDIYIQKASNGAQNSAAAIEQTLQQWTLAEAFYAEEISELAKFTVSRSYAGGEPIVRQGEPGQSLFVVVEGYVSVFKEDQPDLSIASLHAQEIFGEMSLLTGEPRSATVRAEGHAEVLEIQKPGLQKIIARRPDLSEKLAQLVVQRRAAQVNRSADPGAKSASDDGPSLAARIRSFFGL